MALAGDIEKL